MSIYLLQLAGVDAAGASTTFRYSTEGFTSAPDDDTIGGIPSGYPANTHYEARLANPGLVQQDTNGAGRTWGPAEVGGGMIELTNADGGLDTLRSYNFDGAQLTLRRVEPGAKLQTNTLIFTGTVDQVVIGTERVTVRTRDVLHNVNKPLQTTKYGGTNSLPNGMDGVPEDHKGRPIPILLGYNYNITPPCVNTSRLIYQLHCKAFANDATNGINWSIAVYDKRVALTAGALKTLAQFQAGSTDLTYTVTSLPNDELTTSAHGYTTADAVSVAVTGGTLAAPLSASVTYYVRVVSATVVTLHPTAADASANTNRINVTDVGSGTQTISNNRTAAGNYDWCNDATGFFIRLGSTPSGQVTVDAVNPYHDWTPDPEAHFMTNAAGLFQWLAKFRSVTNAAPAIVGADARSQGLYLDQELTILDAFNRVAASIGGFIATNASTISLYRLDLTDTTPDFSFTEAQVLAIEQELPADEFRGMPAWRLKLGYRPNYSPMSDADVAAAVTLADRAWLALPERTVVSEDSAVKTQYANAPELQRSTLLSNATHAGTEADRLRDMYKVKRTLHRLSVPLSLCDGMLLGQLINVTHSRFGLEAGVNFWLIGITRNLLADVAELNLWK
jgi:hypothetical protein